MCEIINDNFKFSLNKHSGYNNPVLQLHFKIILILYILIKRVNYNSVKLIFEICIT